MLKCRGLQGAKCELGKTNFCVEGAECKGFRSKDDKWGVCMCLSDIMTQEDGKCGVDYQWILKSSPKLLKFRI